MIFYLGEKIDNLIDYQTLIAENNKKSWKYGYNSKYDIVIISRNGTLGAIYDIQGLKIGLPSTPNKEDIYNHSVPIINQKWERIPPPKGLTEKTYLNKEYTAYIDKQYFYRKHGYWLYINGLPVWIVGTYWFGLQWAREESKYPDFRIIQNELMIFWEACKADQRCYGMDYVKNRRFGASLLGIFDFLDSGTINENKILGIVSKKGKDAKKIFTRLVRAFKRLPVFFKPLTDGTLNPQTELKFQEQNRKKRIGENINQDEDGLDTIISWQNTEMNALDGDKVFRSLLDEAGKYPPEVPFNEYWYIVKTSHRVGSEIKGKSMVISTVNPLKRGGSNFKIIWDDSNVEERNQNGQTKSGLYRIFIPADYCLEGFFDTYGFSIVDDPIKPTYNEYGKLLKIGAASYLNNEEKSFADDPKGLNEQKRQFPRNIADAFRDDAQECPFNLVKLIDQIDYVENKLNDKFYNDQKKTYLGNDDVDRGNLFWKDGIQDGEVVWRPDPKAGKFYIKKGCQPPDMFKNKKNLKNILGFQSFAPLASHIGTIGIDPYNRSKTVDTRGSYGSASLVTGNHTCDDLPRNSLIVEYISRPESIETFFEDMILLGVYYSVPFLIELSNERFLAKIKERGYRLYSRNNPFKLIKDLSPTEIEFGGAPAQDSKIGDAQFFAVQSFVQNYIGYAEDDSERPKGQIGDFPFTRTLYQLKEVDLSNRKKYDAYISFSLALLGNQKIIIKTEKNIKKLPMLFKKYNNTGNFSKTY